MSLVGGRENCSKEVLRTKGTFLGISAILLWGTLPLLRLMAGEIPSLQLTFMALGTAALVTLLMSGSKGSILTKWASSPESRSAYKATGFLLGAVVFYFAALSLAPAGEVTLVTYLWPLGLAIAICLSAGFLPGPKMWMGIVLAFGGAALALMSGSSQGGNPGMDQWSMLGYMLGLASGGCWIGYSLMLSRLPPDLGLHGRIFAGAALVAVALHLVLESTVWDVSFQGILAAATIGIGPYGLAFLAWGQGLRFGHTGVLSSLCYTVPLVATTLLIFAGAETWRPQLILAALAVAGGAWMASDSSGGK